MRIDRLKLLSKKLRTVPKKRFDMSEWSCGTAMCAFGWATTIPAFKKQGLKLFVKDDGNGYVTCDDRYAPPEDFFEFETEEEAKPFFYDDSIKDPNVIADRIDALVAKAEKA